MLKRMSSGCCTYAVFDCLLEDATPYSNKAPLSDAMIAFLDSNLNSLFVHITQSTSVSKSNGSLSLQIHVLVPVLLLHVIVPHIS